MTGLAADEFEKGGTSFDFQKISDQLFENNKASLDQNLVSNGNFETPLKDKGDNCWVINPAAVQNQLADKELQQRVSHLPIYNIVETSDGKAAYLGKPLAIENLCGDLTPDVSGSLMQTIKLPMDGGSRYFLSFRYRGKVTGKYGGSACAIMCYHNQDGKITSLILNCQDPKPQWYAFSTEFEVPLNTTAITLYLRLDGTGEIYFKDVNLCEVKKDMPLSVVLRPMAWLDNQFFLSSHDPAVMVFSWRRNVFKEKLNLKNPVLCVELPSEVMVKSTWKALDPVTAEEKTICGHKYCRYKIDLSSIRNRPLILDGYEIIRMPSLLVYTDFPAGIELPNAYYWIEEDKKPLTRKESFAMHVLPQVCFGKKPDIFLNGFLNCGIFYLDFVGKENRQLLAKFIAKGNNWIVGGFDDRDLADIYHSNGVKFVTQDLSWNFSNAYLIAPPGTKKPEYARFRTIVSNSNDRELREGTCPTAIYSESDFFKESVIPYLGQKLKGFDGLYANWEPFPYDGKGCFCGKCFDEFVKFSKIPEEEIRENWPKEMLAGKQYYDLWVKFRNWQHAMVVKTIQRTIIAINGDRVGLIPAVSFSTMTDSAKGQNFSKEYRVLDYAKSLKYILPWGNYNGWGGTESFSYRKGKYLQTFIYAKKVREFTDENITVAENRPGLVAHPNGGLYRMSNPEGIVMDVLSYFLNRYEASLIAGFPLGYDNRYWAEYAKLNSLITEHEHLVLQGVPFGGFHVEPETPYPSLVKKTGETFPELRDIPLLQTAGYMLGDKKLVAVGNFWEKGDVFFKLAIKGLNPSCRYVVHEADKNRFFANEGKNFYTNAELEKGILLHAGALRWVFFVIEPYREDVDYGKRTSIAQIKTALNEHLPEIKKWVEFEQKLDSTDAMPCEHKQ